MYRVWRVLHSIHDVVHNTHHIPHSTYDVHSIHVITFIHVRAYSTQQYECQGNSMILAATLMVIVLVHVLATRINITTDY